MENQQFFIITGASGGGKSTLISALAEHGYSTVPEAALTTLREQVACGGDLLPTSKREAFMKAVLARSIKDHESARLLDAPVFFDRGIPEWLRFLNPSDACWQAAAQCRYANKIFLAEPWAEIYVRDHYRRYDFAQATRSYDSTVSAYVQANYEPCILPKVSVRERVAFVLDQVDLAPDKSLQST